MWIYILRRLLLMIPTLFGVTIVSFCIMQLAPGDPLKDQQGVTGAGTGQTREAYLVQRRDLKLDKPLLINDHGFRDYSKKLKIAAQYLSLSKSELEVELDQLSKLPPGDSSPLAANLAFLKSFKIPEFDERLADVEKRPSLAVAIPARAQEYCEDLGSYGARDVFHLLESPDTPLKLQIGLIRALNYMVVEPFVYTYSRNPDESQTSAVVATWKLWWDRAQKEFPPIDPDRRPALEKLLVAAVSEPSENRVFDHLEKFDRDDVRFLAERLLDANTPFRERVVCAIALKLFVSEPLHLNVSVDASQSQVDEALSNWKEHFVLHAGDYKPGLGRQLWNVVADTQYAHMVWRLVTFNFGRSALRTREPVSEKIWDAVKVSAPLMLLTEILIYMLAVPLGVICAVQRGRFLDRVISLKLFLLFSIPPFVAGMLFQLYFCTREYTGWMESVNSVLGTSLQPFPMYGLHSDNYIDYWKRGSEAAVDSTATLGGYLRDYLWHAALPVICLSLFSLAGLAVYGRTSMLDVLNQDYIRTARAKGLPEWKVVLKHALRNGLIPLITLFSSFLPALLGGSVLIEVIFNIPGMGFLSTNSIQNKDFPTLMALVYIDAIVVMLSILLTDILYVVVDPRINFAAREG